MIGAIIKDGFEVHDGITRERAVDAGLAQTLFDRGEEVLGDAAAEDFLGKDHLFALLVGLEADPNVTELAAAAGLLLMTALLGDRLADLFTVGHARRVEHDLDAEAALELVDEHVDLDVAHAGDDHLVRFGVVDDAEGRIFLVQAVEALSHLILLAAGLGRDGDAVAGLIERDGLDLDDLARLAERVAGLDLVHLGDGADVAAGELLDLGILLALGDVQAAELLGLAGAGVDHGHIGLDGAGEHLDVGILAVLVGNGLEDERGRQCAGRDDELGGLAVLILGHQGAGVLRLGKKLDDGIHQDARAHALNGGAAHDREEGQVLNALAQAMDHLGIGEVFTGEELFHKFLARLGDGLLERVVELIEHGLFVLRHFDLDAAAAGAELERALMQHVDDADDLLALVPDGGDDGGDVLAEALAQRVERGVVVGVLLVGLGDVEQTGERVLLAIFPRLFRADAHAGLGRADDDGSVGSLNGLRDLTGEVEAAGHVEHVDLAAVVFHGSHGQRNGDLAADLFGIVVTNGVAVGNSAQTVRAAGEIQHALSEGGLAAAAVAKQHDIADVFCTHNGSVSFRKS